MADEYITVSRTLQIMFRHDPSNSHALCKVDIKKLNWKLQKLQKEGMTILGIYVEYEKKHIHGPAPIIQSGAQTGRVEESHHITEVERCLDLEKQ